MARMDGGNCVYVGRRSVCALLSSEVRDHCFSIPLSYSYFTASNLRTLFVEQETACVDGDLLSRLFCLFSMDSPRWTNLDFKYGFLRRFYFPVLIFFFVYLYKYQRRFSQPYPQSMAVPAYPNFSLVQSTDFGFPCCRMNPFSAFWYSSKDFGDLNQIVQYFAVAKDLSVFWSEILSSISLCACSICPFYYFPHLFVSCLFLFFFLSQLSIFETDIFLLSWTYVAFSPLTWHVYSSGHLHA